ncbi:MAG: outer membrane protein OmpA-like peptidoglycan-associated protein [Cryomorphaceae bacterium]|jgi:outer membrane protein OmpA-like peptidoglycan-associated protein
MANTEKISNQSSPSQNTTPASAPSVAVSTPFNSAPANNKPNPNIVMALVLCFMLIIGLALAFVFKENNGLDGESQLTELTEKEKLQRLIDAERGGASPDSRASAAALEGRIASILENTHAIQSEFESVRVGYTGAKAKLVQAENVAKGNINTISRLGSENTNLKGQIAQLQILASSAQAYQNQAQQLANSNAEKAALIVTLQGRPSNESIEQLRKALSNEQLAKEEVIRKSQGLERKMLTMIDDSRQDNGQVAELQKQNEELKAQLQALRTKVDMAKLFVKSHMKLPLYAQALYNELKVLEGFSSEKLREAYTRLGTELHAENLQVVKFATGSSILNFTDKATITNKLTATSETDYFLVVGYASKTGEATSNETLSANRATAVASVVNELKKEGQDVRAVYLGQTNRFSKSVISDNQLCEIWRIKKH